MTYVASPSTRSYAGEKGVDLAELARNTGRETLAREDVDRHLAGELPAAARPDAGAARFWQVDHAAHGPVREERMPRIARIAAETLGAANALIPQVTHHDRADLRALEAFRSRQRDTAARRGIRLTALAFHVMALARCLRAFPKFNASLSPDGATLILKDYVHVGIAVDTPHGLTVPVIRNADRKGLFEIAGEVTDLASRAQDRKLRPDDMGGASMTISNLGGIGGIGFTPIVNPPELAILGLTRSETVPRWEDGGWIPAPMVPLDLSYDHRVINGADAARFLRHHAGLIEDPRRLLL
jgi:pyruvate/2-oxoglutarate dehydrogenase complex dihydrolipoamide acyltransferase (E2) component